MTNIDSTDQRKPGERPPAEWAERLGNLKRKSGQWEGPCPVCGGTDRFSISEKRKGGSGTRVHCRGGCKFGELASAVFPETDAVQDTTSTYEPHANESKHIDEELAGVFRPEGRRPPLAEPPEMENYPEELPASPPEEPQVYGCTIDQFYAHTGLVPQSDTGITRGRCWVSPEVGEVDAVRIPYFNEDGEEIGAKFRVVVSGKDKYRYEKGSTAQLYGVPWLELARSAKKLVVVEGETDQMTLALKQIPAVGVPGASAAKVITREHIDGIDKVYVVEEDDPISKAGEKFVLAVAERLREIGSKAVVLRVVLRSHVDDKLVRFKDTNEMFKAGKAAFAGRFKRCCLDARGLRASKVAYREVADIMRTTYPPVRWVVRGLLPEGLAVCYSAPKAGKSFWALQLIAAVKHAAPFCGNAAWTPDLAEIGIIDLEQVEGAQMQGRFEHHGVTRDDYGIKLTSEFPTLDNGGLEELDILLEENPAMSLVVIDVWTNVKPSAKGGDNAYDREYRICKELRTLFLRRRACCLVIHHDRKSDGGGITDKASGSKALIGAANSVLWIQRETGKEEGTMTVTGREVEDAVIKCNFHNRLWTVDLSEEDGKGWT